MIRILLIGGGVAASRYVESLIWTSNYLAIAGFDCYGKSKQLSTFYDLPYYHFYDMEKIELNSYHLAIVCVPVEMKCRVVQWLVSEMQYRGRVILEKPFVIGVANIRNLLETIDVLDSCIVACQRDFDLENYKIPQSNEYRIIWKSINDSLHDNIVHMMPHLLSWIILELDSSDIDLHICNHAIVGTIGEKKVDICFIYASDNYVEINGKQYASPNYRKINAQIAKIIFELSKEETKRNIERAVLVAEVISELVNEEGEKNE